MEGGGEGGRVRGREEKMETRELGRGGRGIIKVGREERRKKVVGEKERKKSGKNK